MYHLLHKDIYFVGIFIPLMSDVGILQLNAVDFLFC